MKHQNLLQLPFLACAKGTSSALLQTSGFPPRHRKLEAQSYSSCILIIVISSMINLYTLNGQDQTYSCPSIPLGSGCALTSQKASSQVSFPALTRSISSSLGSKTKYQRMARRILFLGTRCLISSWTLSWAMNQTAKYQKVVFYKALTGAKPMYCHLSKQKKE